MIHTNSTSRAIFLHEPVDIVGINEIPEDSSGLNILFLSTEIPYPLHDGHHLRTFNVLKLLARTHDIHFLGFVKERREKDFIPPISKFCKTVEVFRIRSGLRDPLFLWQLLRNLFSADPFIVQRYFNRETLSRLKGIISEYNIDLVHLDMLHLSRYGKYLPGLPKILVNHNVESLRTRRLQNVEKNLFARLYLGIQYRKLYRYERKIFHLFDRCIVVSEEDRRLLQNMSGGDNFAIIPNGVDADYFKPDGDGAGDKRLTWVGGMGDQYNKDAVLFFIKEIFPLIQTAIPDCAVTFVGQHPPAEILQQQQSSDNIITTGYIEDVRPYVARSAVVIAPMRSGSGTKLKVLNAMAQGKAVVTTSIGAEGIEARPDKEIIIADTPKEFAEKTVFLLQDPESAREIGRRARKVIEEKYDWRVIENEMRRLYLEVKRCSDIY